MKKKRSKTKGRLRMSPKIRKVKRHERKQRGSRWTLERVPGEERLYRVYRDFMWLAIIVPGTKGAPGTMRDISEARISFVIGGKLKGPLSAP